MRVTDYSIEFRCAKCGESASFVSGYEIDKDLQDVVEKADNATRCFHCDERTVACCRISANLLEQKKTMIKWDIKFKCMHCKMSFRSEYWREKGDHEFLKDPGSAGIVCVNAHCKSSDLYVVEVRQIAQKTK